MTTQTVAYMTAVVPTGAESTAGMSAHWLGLTGEPK